MAGLPILMRKLFANSGFGPLLNLGIMPTELQRRTADTGSIVLPKGTTAQRDATAAAGSLRFNSTTGMFEGFTGTAWQSLCATSDGRSVPLGTCSMHMCRITSGAAVAPEGYLICDGSQINHSDYPDLCELLWQFTTFAGNGSSYAILPNLHHRFLEGTTSVGEIASYVEAGLPDITGELSQLSSSLVVKTGVFAGSYVLKSNYTSIAGNGQDEFSLRFDSCNSNALYGNSSTIQPASVRTLPCIRF